MTFDDWVKSTRREALTPDDVNLVKRLGDAVDNAVRDPTAPADLSIEDIFDAMRRYCSGRYRYSATGRGLAPSLRDKRLDCGAAADLVAGVILYVSGRDLQVQRIYGVFNGNGQRPAITPRIQQPGVVIENNLNGGGGRMLFSGGHFLAKIEDDQFDLITGLRHHTIDFLEAVKLEPVDGQPVLQREIDGVTHRFVRIGQTAQELSRFRVEPPLPE